MIEFNNYILWCQGESPTAKSVTMIDGEKVDGTLEQEVFDFLCMTPDSEQGDNQNGWKVVFQNNRTKTFDSVKAEKLLSPSFKLFEDEKGYIMIHSHFMDKDESDRRIVYMFCTKAQNYKIAGNTLLKASEVIGRHPNPADIQFMIIRSYWKVYRIVLYSLVCLILIAFVLWLIFLFR